MKRYFLIDNASVAAQYGVGTYIRQMKRILQSISDLELAYIDMYSDVKEYTIQNDEDGYVHYKIPVNYYNGENSQYCRNIFYFIIQNIHLHDGDIVFFHFNYYHHLTLAKYLKAHDIRFKIILTLHYMNWCFELNGNLTQYKKILSGQYSTTADERACGYEPIDERKVESVLNDRDGLCSFLHIADEVIVLSNFAKELCIKEYHVVPEKLHLIYNGIENSQSPIDKSSFNYTNLNFAEKRIIVYVGRLEKTKGTDYLIQAFTQMCDRYPDIHLVLIGGGNIERTLTFAKYYWDRITFLGKVEKAVVDYFYRLAVIGVLPSFGEQCSYAAIEMMSYGIPMIITDSTGLKEMLDDCPKNIVHVDEGAFNENELVAQLVEKMQQLLDDSHFHQECSRMMYNIYEGRYTFGRMTNSVKQLLIEMALERILLKEDFLQKIENKMIRFIHFGKGLDYEFFGMTGIGCYIWWRIQKKLQDKDGNKLKIYALQEQMIHYLDWLYDEIWKDYSLRGVCEPCIELRWLLHSLFLSGFYKTRVQEISAMLSISHDSIRNLNEYDILSNSVKIYNSKCE